MNRENLRAVLEILKQRDVLKGVIRSSGARHFGFSCLFARWRHRSKRDRRPSMTAEISDAGASILRCHTGDCHYKGTLAQAVSELNVMHEGRLTDLSVWVMQNDGTFVLSFDGNKSPRKPTNYNDELLKRLENPFPEIAVRFLAEKGNTLKTIEFMRCAWIDSEWRKTDEGKDYEIKNSIVFPVIVEEDGRYICIGAQSREAYGPEWKPKYTTFFSFQSSEYLYGEHLLSRVRGDRLLVVEGPLDANHLIGLGYTAVAVFGSYLGAVKALKIKRAAPRRVVIIADPDRPGIEAADRMVTELTREGLEATVINFGIDPKRLSEEQLRDIWK